MYGIKYRSENKKIGKIIYFGTYSFKIYFGGQVRTKNRIRLKLIGTGIIYFRRAK